MRRESVQGQVPARGLVVDSPQAEGCPPSSSIFPKIVDPPQEECGTQGVDQANKKESA